MNFEFGGIKVLQIYLKTSANVSEQSLAKQANLPNFSHAKLLSFTVFSMSEHAHTHTHTHTHNFQAAFMQAIIPTVCEEYLTVKNIAIADQFTKFYMPIFHFTLISFGQTLDPQMFSLPNMFRVPIYQSFLPCKVMNQLQPLLWVTNFPLKKSSLAASSQDWAKSQIASSTNCAIPYT